MSVEVKKQKISARNHVFRAVKKGALTRPLLCSCGSANNVQAHHEDYSKPLEIIWLCRECHLDQHFPTRHDPKVEPQKRLCKKAYNWHLRAGINNGWNG